MKKNKLRPHQSFIFKALFITLLAASTVSSAWSATNSCENLFPFAGDFLAMDQSDVAIAQERSGLRKVIRKALGADPYLASDQDSESIAKLKTLMAKREFSTWFRFNNEVLRNLKSAETFSDALVKPIITPQEGHMAKIMMIRQAKYTVDLTYYIFELDDTGYSLVNELRKAIRRGVNVRLMVDSLGAMASTIKGNPHFKALIADAEKHAGYVTDPGTGLKTNIRAKLEILTFNPVSNVLGWFRSRSLDFFNFVGRHLAKDASRYEALDTTHWNPDRRSHDKIIITDADFPELSIGMIGGRNIGNNYSEMDPNNHDNYRDLEVMYRNDPEKARSLDRTQSVGRIVSEQFERLYFFRANRRMARGLITFLTGGQKALQKMHAAGSRIVEVTKSNMDTLNEDASSSDFGKKYLSSGFVPQELEFVNSTENLLRSMSEVDSAITDSVRVQDANKILQEAEASNLDKNLLSQVVKLMRQEKEAVVVISPYLWISEKDAAFIGQFLIDNPQATFTVYTNSVLTSDNMPAQVLVDTQTAPNLLALSQNPIIGNRVKIFEYGRADDVRVGGKSYYGKLHLKGAFFKSVKTSVAGTYNKDPRSQFLNSETAVIIRGAEYAENMQREIADIHAKSHEWGSPEFLEIRSNPKLQLVKREAVKYQLKLYDILTALKVWWMI